MKVIDHWNITRENDSKYTRFFLDDGKTLELEASTQKWTLKGKSGRKINNQDSVIEAIKSVIQYFEESNK